uniref:Uncharacterized protein n=1 Tax=uncultured prokaryote TaxID=198431 RepID=A0A0H5Q730_9ZZZZ|nr:hypothetical protein [uncultured prokaryote]
MGVSPTTERFQCPTIGGGAVVASGSLEDDPQPRGGVAVTKLDT